MASTTVLVRRVVIGVVSAGALTTGVLGGSPVALADPPNCTMADLAGVAAGVSAATSAYLFTHPDVNEFMTGLKGQPRDQVLSDIQQYLDARPQVKDEVSAIRAPLREIRERCGVGVDMPSNDIPSQ
jgi:hemophore-related protein